jgi:hypothetical protein
MPLPPRLSQLLSPEGLGLLVDLLLRAGLVSGAVLAVAMGKLMLAAMLAAIALGMFLRVWRTARRSKRG